jgi:hypothetical protein
MFLVDKITKAANHRPLPELPGIPYILWDMFSVWSTVMDNSNINRLLCCFGSCLPCHKTRIVVQGNWVHFDRRGSPWRSLQLFNISQIW